MASTTSPTPPTTPTSIREDSPAQTTASTVTPPPSTKPATVKEDGPAKNPFNILAIETLQHIATYIPYDSDICTFRAICRSTHDAIDADNCSFWRRRFLSTFEKPANSEEWKGAKGNLKFRAEYQKRRYILKHGVENVAKSGGSPKRNDVAIFLLGDTAREKGCLEVLRDLAVDSFSEMKDDGKVYESPNLAFIKQFLQANGLLSLFNPTALRAGNSKRGRSSDPPGRPTLLMRTLQVLCAPMMLSFEPHNGGEHFGFPDSQLVVYSTEKDVPIFGGCHGLDVNMDFVLHSLNFWKYHMLREVEWTLFQAFSELEEDEKPRWWSGPLTQGVKKLGKHWKGSYSYVNREDIETIRFGRADNEQVHVQDSFAGENDGHAFQDMTLELVREGESFAWPKLFEQCLRSLAVPQSRAKTRAQQRSAKPEEVVNFKPQSFHFEGEGSDQSEQFFASGWLNQLPPQQGIPGWQRMTMMKYFEDEDGTLDDNSLWAYEGVVLPGGQIVVGRWWSPMDGLNEYYSGSFILWCVDGPKYEEQEQQKKEEETGGNGVEEGGESDEIA